MRQLTLTLTKDADIDIINRILENIKGIENISYSESFKKDNKRKAQNLINKIREIRDEIDLDKIDLDDERTKYLLSK